MDEDLKERAKQFAAAGRAAHEAQQRPLLVNVPPAGDEERLIAVLIDLIMSTCVYDVPAEKPRRAA